jgi:hypothetical protein
MKKILKRFFTKPAAPEVNWPPVDLQAKIDKIKQIEEEQNIDLGRRIYQFDYKQYELCLDRDVIGMYRVIAFIGKERRFSFSIKCEYKDYTNLKKGYEEIATFFDGDQHIRNLPNNELLKGHYFGS